MLSQTEFSPITDKANSKFIVTVYHERQWKAGYAFVNFNTYYMKYMQENKDYTEQTAHKIELGRIVRIVETKLTGKFSNNKIKTILVYINQNRGNKKFGDNQEFAKIVIKDNQITQFYCNHTEQFWIDFMQSIAQQVQEKLNTHCYAQA